MEAAMTLVVEVAEIRVTDPAGFEAAVTQTRPHFLAAEGCLGLALHRVSRRPTLIGSWSNGAALKTTW
jgi:quinol monooxygenase YgiN